jgi:hypothetical protein
MKQHVRRRTCKSYPCGQPRSPGSCHSATGEEVGGGCPVLARPNSHEENHSSWQIIERLASRSPPKLCVVPPIFLDYYLTDSGDSTWVGVLGETSGILSIYLRFAILLSFLCPRSNGTGNLLAPKLCHGRLNVVGDRSLLFSCLFNKPSFEIRGHSKV